YRSPTLLQASQKEDRWPTFTPPEAGLSRRYRGLILHRRSQPLPARIGRHQFSLVGYEENTELFAGNGMIAATFMRRVAEYPIALRQGLHVTYDPGFTSAAREYR
ncbi:hypothetical protein, partial [Devosia sp. A369]